MHPLNAARRSHGVLLSLGRTAAQITAQFAPLPGMAPLAEVLCILMVLAQNVSQNRHAAQQLVERCHRLALCLHDKAIANENVSTAITAVSVCLREIQIRMEQWGALSNIRAFIRQDEIAKDILNCNNALTDCFTNFQLTSQLAMHEWQSQLQLENERDKQELLGYLTNIENATQITQEATLATREDMHRIMALMQNFMGENLRTADRVHTGLSSNLYDLSSKTRELLPDFYLNRGEVQRIGSFPISGTAAMDIYEGLYLQREKVAIKVIRAVNADEHSIRRFKRECEIWKEVWRVDQGKHVLPFYGFSDDGPFPYMVSPWMPNGTALTYVKQKDTSIDYVRLIKGVALGIQVLHNMSIVHGDVKASNIVVDGLGNPLLADFGLSRIVEDITGIPFSQSRGVSDSYRWFAPEVCIGQGVLSLNSDVYAYAMTVLELFTHSQPFNEIKHTTEVVIRSAKGEQPARPVDPRVLHRGLDDNLWMLLQRCWVTEPTHRPRIGDVLAMFPQ
ncbi:TKL/TKL-ccin protein kinase [Mycena kentingensis (nom. inval.)]|nr:TKL/TKL-ccin protein kinase [Mycena kentingensis (nom. inval.)]